MLPDTEKRSRENSEGICKREKSAASSRARTRQFGGERKVARRKIKRGFYQGSREGHTRWTSVGGIGGQGGGIKRKIRGSVSLESR